MQLSLPFQIENQHIVVNVRLTPKGGQDRVDGVITLSDGRVVLAARVRAVPEEGAANTALLKLLASQLGVSASSITLVSGATSRMKRIKLPHSEVVMEKLTRLCAHPM